MLRNVKARAREAVIVFYPTLGTNPGRPRRSPLCFTVGVISAQPLPGRVPPDPLLNTYLGKLESRTNCRQIPSSRSAIIAWDNLAFGLCLGRRNELEVL